MGTVLSTLAATVIYCRGLGGLEGIKTYTRPGKATSGIVDCDDGMVCIFSLDQAPSDSFLNSRLSCK